MYQSLTEAATEGRLEHVLDDPARLARRSSGPAYGATFRAVFLSQSDAVSGTIAYGRSPAGEITSITNNTFQNSGNPANLVSNVVNGPDGPATYQLGNGLNVYKLYDSMGRGTGRWLCNGPATQSCNGGVQVYGNSQQFKGAQVPWNDDTAVGTQLVYGYDNINRLASTSLYQASSPLYTYSYDLYGNRWSQTSSGGSTFSLSFDPTTNRVLTAGYAYDAAGNMTNDSFHAYTFDAEGNILSVDNGSTAKYVYDALNQRVQNQVGSSTMEYVYDVKGRRISTWAEPANTGSEGRIYSDSQQIAFRASDGTTYFDHQDYLGTERMRTNSGGAVAATYSSLPWGDGYSATVSKAAGDQDSAHFADLDQDVNSANAAMSEHAQFRNYSFQQGRWLSPDPYDGSYDATNPQSFNRYAYVFNNPLSFTDRLGLDCDDDSGTWGPGSSDGNLYVDGGCYPDGGGPGTYPCLDFGSCTSTNYPSNIGNTAYSGGVAGALPPLGPPHLARLSQHGSSTIDPSNGQVPVHGPWHYGNYCGAGGMGTPTNAIDAACQHHDKQFGNTGADWTNMQSVANWNKLNQQQQIGVQQANQDLCNAMASIYPTIPSWNLSQSVAALEIYWYFALAVPQGAQCHP